MGLKSKIGPITALAITSATIIWMYAGGNGITTAQADSKTPVNESVLEHSEKQKKQSVQAKTLTAQYITNSIKLSGQTQAQTVLDLTNQVAGEINSISVTKGEFVRKGETILAIDRRTLEAKSIQARSLIKQRSLELDGIKRLSNDRLTSQVSVAEADAALSSARATLKELEVSLEKTVVKAPFSGVLNAFSVKPGQVLSAGANVGTLVQVDPLKVVVNVPQNYLGKVTIGTLANVTLDNGLNVESQVTFVSAVADSATRTIPVEISVPNESHDIPAGISAQVTFELDEIKAHALSPSLLAVDAQGNMSIKTLSVDNQVVENRVNIIRSDRDKVWVTGLPTNVNIISVGQGFVSAGDVVEAHYQH